VSDPVKSKKRHREVIGLIPSGGQATRIAPLPCSKELYPIGFHRMDGVKGLRPKAAAHYLLEKMRCAGIRTAYFILRKGKWDIPSYFGDGKPVRMNLAYLMMRVPHGTPFTLDQAYAFVRGKTIAFGFPDIIFDADDAFVKLLDRQASTRADVVLGLFLVRKPETMDMIDVDGHGAVRSIIIKPHATKLRYGWIMATWNPVFSQFLHEYLRTSLAHRRTNITRKSELSVGHIFQAALESGLQIQSVRFRDSSYLDIGTPDNLIKAVCDQRFFKQMQS